MKLNKYIYVLPIMCVVAFTSSSYAQNDIQDILFNSENTAYSNSEVDVIFSSDDDSIQSDSLSYDDRKEIDDMIEKALEIATIEEEKRRLREQEEEEERQREERRREEERKTQEERQREEERQRQEEKRRQEEKNKKEEEIEKHMDKAYDETLDTALNKNSKEDIKEHDLEQVSTMGEYAKTLLGIPYVYGGTSLKGMDCSAFVQRVYSKFDIKIPRTTFQQIKLGKSIDFSNMKANDLIFFDTRAKSLLLKHTKNVNTTNFEDVKINESETHDTKLYPTEPTHVGIYLGNGKFAHASSSKKKIVIENIKNSYFINRIVDIKRYV